VVALGISLYSAYSARRSRQISLRSLSLSEEQEKRRQPRFGIYLSDGYRRYLPDKQIFGFRVSVRNPTDSNNAISMAELRVTYLINEKVKATCRIPHDPSLSKIGNSTEKETGAAFLIPSRIDARQTAVGWMYFAFENSALGGKTIDSHTILLEDSHGICTESEPIAVKEWANEDAEA
jgi:hypothetical protein